MSMLAMLDMARNAGRTNVEGSKGDAETKARLMDEDVGLDVLA